MPPRGPGRRLTGAQSSDLHRASLDSLLRWLLVKARGRAGVLLLTLIGEQFKYMVHLDFKATNNMVEYEALILGLSTTLSLRVWQLLAKGDSHQVIKQVNGECSCHDP
jgi:ribonuclease HI